MRGPPQPVMADALIEQEADESGDEVDKEEEAGGEDLNEYQKDGFVVDDAEADEEKGDDGLGDSSSDDDDDDDDDDLGGGRLRRNRERSAPDEDDLELIQENLEGAAAEAEAAEAEAPKKRPRDGDDGEAQLFDDDDEDDEPKEKKAKGGGDLYDEDNFDDFIEDDLGIQGALQREEKMATSRARHTGGGGAPEGVSQLQMMDMIDIFGEDAEDLAKGGAFDSDEEDYGEMPKAKGATGNFRATYEPGMLSDYYVTPADEAIRKRDLPERLQLRSVAMAKRTRRDYETFLDEEASWIAAKLRAPRAPSTATIATVKQVLRFFNEDAYEVPFVASYRRDYLATSDVATSELWTIFDLDDEWARLNARRKDTIKIVKQLRSVVESPPPRVAPGLKAARTADDTALRDARAYAKHCFNKRGHDDGKRRPGKREAAFWTAVRSAGLEDFGRKFSKTLQQVDDALRNPDAAPTVPPTPDE